MAITNKAKSIQAEKAAAEASVDKARPLSPSASTALRKLIDNDFENLRTQIVEFAAEIEEQYVTEVNEKWAERDKDREKIEALGRKAISDYQATRESLYRMGRDSGIHLSLPEFGYSKRAEATLLGKEEAIKAAHKKATRERDKAFTIAERARLTAQRQVLLATVTAEAEALLTSIPSAKDLIKQARENTLSIEQ